MQPKQKNHFSLFKYMLDTIEDKLTEDMIKKFHFILDGTLTESEKEWFNVGKYKQKKNFVGNIRTIISINVPKNMKKFILFKMKMEE